MTTTPTRRRLTAALAAALTLGTLVAAGSTAQAATRNGPRSTETTGDARAAGGNPTARQRTLSDLHDVSLAWFRPSPDQHSLLVRYSLPGQSGSPASYEFRDNIRLGYTTTDGRSHAALITVDPSDTSQSPFGFLTMSGPHVAQAQETGADCGPGYIAAVSTAGSGASISVPVECFGPMSAITSLRLEHTSRLGTARATDTASIATMTARPPGLAAFRSSTTLDKRGDHTYTSSTGGKYADLTKSVARYDPATNTLTQDITLVALSTTAAQLRQRITFNIDGDMRSQTAVAFVPRSGGKPGSFSLTGCEGETMRVDRKARTVRLTIPRSCIHSDSLNGSVWLHTLRGGRISVADSITDVRGVNLF